MPDLKNILRDSLTDAMSGQTINQSSSNEKSKYIENPLHQYASYNYVLTLSGLSSTQLENPKSILSDPVHDIIARTGGIGDANAFSENSKTLDHNFFQKNKTVQADRADTFSRSLKLDPELEKRADYAVGILKKNRDIYFEKLEIDSYAGPNPHRKLMNYGKMQITLTEPNGITLWQKIRAAAFNCGYLEHLIAPYLLTIEFKGFNSLGIEVANNIVRKMPIQISESTMNVNAGGTTYTLTAVPYTELASQNRYLYTRAQGTIEGKGSDLSSYLRSFQKNLNEAQQREVNEGLRDHPDEYKITADPMIGKAVDLSNNASATTGTTSQLQPVQYGKSASIGYILERFVLQFDQFRKIDEIVKNRFNDISASASYDDNSKLPAPWVPWFKIITTVKVLPGIWDSKLQSHKRQIHFHIKPYNIHLGNFIQVGIGSYPSWQTLVRKRYKYIYTGENLDILDLDIQYNTNYAKASLLTEPYATNQKNNPTIVDKLKTILSVFQIFSGGGSTGQAPEGDFSPYPEPLLPLRGVVTTSTSDDGVTKGKEDSSPVQSFYDFLTNNYSAMVTLNMKIMGDPAYLGQDLYIPMTDPGESNSYSKTVVGALNGVDWDDKRGCFNFDEYQPIVGLDFRFPSDFNENQGLYEFTQQETAQFTGLYRITQTVSTFERGQFTQDLTMIRFENQNNPTPIIIKTQSTTTEKTEAQIKGGTGQVTDNPYPDQTGGYKGDILGYDPYTGRPIYSRKV